jgi:hypothetical protein
VTFYCANCGNNDRPVRLQKDDIWLHDDNGRRYCGDQHRGSGCNGGTEAYPILKTACEWQPFEDDEEDPWWSCSPIGGTMEAFMYVQKYKGSSSSYVWKATLLDEYVKSGDCPTLLEAQITAEHAIFDIAKAIADESQKRFQAIAKALGRAQKET